MIIVIARTPEDALAVARLSNFGTNHYAHPTESAARDYARRFYPDPQLSRYYGWRVPVSHDGTLLEPSPFSLDAPRENA